MNLLLFGPPGAGKGTQSALLKNKLGVGHISTGDLFRKAMKLGTTLGTQARQYIDGGQLVPDSITIALVREELASLRSGFVLDGFPRTLEQAKALSTMLAELGQSLDAVISLVVPVSVLIGRLAGRRVCRSCGAVYHVADKKPTKAGICDQCGGELYQRSDDNETVVGQRLRAYEESTKPLEEYYRTAALLIEIDGLGAADEIFDRIVKSFSKFKK